MFELPDDGLPVIERTAVRLVVLDIAGSAGRLLLFHTRDRCQPDLGAWWELPGGGMEPAETYRDAAIRELREETGIVTARSQVGPPTWRRRASFRHRQARRLQRFYPGQLPALLGTFLEGQEIDEPFELWS